MESLSEFYRSNFTKPFLARARERRVKAEAVARREQRRIEAERKRQEKERSRQELLAGLRELAAAPKLRQESAFARIVRRICLATGVAERELFSDLRDRRIVLARQAVCYWAARRTRMSYSQIGRKLNRDHTTCLHAVSEYPKKRLRKGRHLRPARVRP